MAAMILHSRTVCGVPLSLTFDNSQDAEVFQSVVSNSTITEMVVENWHLSAGQVVILLLLVSALFLLYRKIMTNLRERSYVVLEFGDGRRIQREHLCTLIGCLSTFAFSADQYIDQINIVQCPPTILIKWPTFKITNIFIKSAIPLPSRVRLRQFIHSTAYYVIVLVQSENKVRLLEFANQGKSTQQPNSIPVKEAVTGLDRYLASHAMGSSTQIPINLEVLKVYPSLSNLTALEATSQSALTPDYV